MEQSFSQSELKVPSGNYTQTSLAVYLKKEIFKFMIWFKPVPIALGYEGGLIMLLICYINSGGILREFLHKSWICISGESVRRRGRQPEPDARGMDTRDRSFMACQPEKSCPVFLWDQWISNFLNHSLSFQKVLSPSPPPQEAAIELQSIHHVSNT